MSNKLRTFSFNQSKEPVSLPKWGKWLIGAVAAGGLAVGGYTAVDNASELKEGEVYVVNSETAKSYHINRGCATLKNAKHRIKKGNYIHVDHKIDLMY